MTKQATLNHIGYLDGLRGIAALWVMVGHILSTYGKFPPIVSWTSLAVDIFILLSGFLMVRQVTAREIHEPLDLPQTWLTFWLRRLFRLAPLYYTVFFIVTLCEQYNNGFDGSFRYSAWDSIHTANNQFTLYVFSHITFLFGLSPELHKSASSLPDWSISLEMQFYAVFPFLMLLGRRIGWLKLAAIVAAICLASDLIFASFLHQFTLPSILVLKLHIFMGGMLIALASQRRDLKLLYLLAAIALMILPIWGSDGFKLGLDRALICFGFGLLALGDQIKAPSSVSWAISQISQILGKRPFVVLADLSYGVYLIHYSIIIVWSRLTGPNAPLSSVNNLVVALIIIPIIAYGLAGIARRAIELPSIELGRRVIRRYRNLLLAEAH